MKQYKNIVQTIPKFRHGSRRVPVGSEEEIALKLQKSKFPKQRLRNYSNLIDRRRSNSAK